MFCKYDKVTNFFACLGKLPAATKVHTQVWMTKILSQNY